MLLLLPIVALAAERQPLPALAVERPLSLPLGWTMLEVGTARQGVRRDLRARVRYGALRGVELFVGGAAIVQEGRAGPGDPDFGARLQLLRREPPNTALALEVSFRAPYGAAPGDLPLAEGAPELSVSAQLLRQWGPLALTAEAGPRLRGEGQSGKLPDGLGGELALLLQVGPLAPQAQLQGELRRGEEPWAMGGIGLLVQLSRGLGAVGALSWPWAGEDADRTLPDGPVSRIGLEIAF